MLCPETRNRGTLSDAGLQHFRFLRTCVKCFFSHSQNDDILPQIRKPVLITHGVVDAVVKPSAALQQKSSIPHAELHLMEMRGMLPSGTMRRRSTPASARSARASASNNGYNSCPELRFENSSFAVAIACPTCRCV